MAAKWFTLSDSTEFDFTVEGGAPLPPGGGGPLPPGGGGPLPPGGGGFWPLPPCGG